MPDNHIDHALSTTIVGGLPDPLGGVTTFVSRLASGLAGLEGRRIEVLDLYPQKNKAVAHQLVDHKIAPRNAGLRFLWLCAQVVSKRVVHFNFSSPNAIFLLLLLPKRRSTWLLTLHHGDLASYPSKFQYRWIWKLVGRRVDGFVALSESQLQFYCLKGIPQAKQKLGSSYVRMPINCSDVGSEIRSLMESKRRTFSKIVFASGYPTKAYQHIELLQAFQAFAELENACLIMCLYGPDREGLRSSIVALAETSSVVHVVGQVSENDFAYLLRTCDVYVRANSVDSCGIAVFDAVAMGKPVVASDVCTRPADAHVFEAGNIAELQKCLRKVLSQEPPEAQSELHDALSFYDSLYANPTAPAEALAEFSPNRRAA